MTRDARTGGGAGGWALGVVILVAVLAFGLPRVAPQATCDAFSPWMRCADGTVARCELERRAVTRGTAWSVRATCGERELATTAITATGFVLVFATLVAVGVVRFRAARRRRDQDLLQG